MIKGFTLGETLVVIGLLGLVILALGQVLIGFYQSFDEQRANLAVISGASLMANQLRDAVLESSQILVSHDFSGQVYTTSSAVLVLEMPSIDAAGNILAGQKDYVVFYAGSNFLYQLTEAAPASSRKSSLRGLSSEFSSWSLTYNNADVKLATKVSADINFQSQSGKQVFQYHLHQDDYLRNR